MSGSRRRWGGTRRRTIRCRGALGEGVGGGGREGVAADAGGGVPGGCGREAEAAMKGEAT